jgi:hypothetical protein
MSSNNSHGVGAAWVLWHSSAFLSAARNLCPHTRLKTKRLPNLSPWTDAIISPKLRPISESEFTHMIQGKRGRGRPPGASRLNALDAKILDQMADIIAGRPMPPTTAMRQLGIEDDTMRRRLRRKWNAGGPVRVQAIKARHQRAQLQVAAKVACEKFYAFANAPELAAAVKSLNQFTQSPVWLEFGRKFEAISQSPFMQAIQAFAKSPEAKRLA